MYCAHARLTHLPFSAPTNRVSRHAQPFRQPRRNRQHARNGYEREPRVHQERRSGLRGATTLEAAPTNLQQNQARRWSQRIDDGGQAQSRRQVRAEEPQQNPAQGHLQDASDDARLVVNGMGHSPDQGMEPRSGQHAQTHADQRGKGAARGTRTHSRTTTRVGVSGPDQVSSAEGQHGRHANGTRSIDLMGPTGTLLPNQICDEVRFCRLDKTYKADIKIITLNIVSPEKRLLVLEPLGQTEAEHKYGRALSTAME